MIQPLQPERLTEYYVIFTQGVTHWITRWLKPNFSHIYIVTRDEYNWIILNPTRLYLQVIIPAASINDDYPRSMLKPDDSCLKLTFTQRDDTQQFGSVGLLNCVQWSKYVLGLRIFCLTPYRLYKRLLNFKPDTMLRHGLKSIERVQG